MKSACCNAEMSTTLHPYCIKCGTDADSVCAYCGEEKIHAISHPDLGAFCPNHCQCYR